MLAANKDVCTKAIKNGGQDGTQECWLGKKVVAVKKISLDNSQSPYVITGRIIMVTVNNLFHTSPHKNITLTISPLDETTSIDIDQADYSIQGLDNQPSLKENPLIKLGSVGRNEAGEKYYCSGLVFQEETGIEAVILVEEHAGFEKLEWRTESVPVNRI